MSDDRAPDEEVGGSRVEIKGTPLGDLPIPPPPVVPPDVTRVGLPTGVSPSRSRGTR